MFEIPSNSKLYYAYPDKLVFSLYGKVGEVVKVVRVKSKADYKKIEKKLYKYFFPNQATAKFPTSHTRKLTYQQFDNNNNLINQYSFEELIETSFSFVTIRRAVKYGFSYKGFYWKAIKNSIKE